MSVTFEPGLLKAYFVAGTQDLQPTQSLPGVLTDAILAGITAFQFREKGPNALKGLAKRQLAEILQKKCKAANIPFIIDDDLELAMAIDADGIHVGQDDLAVQTVLSRVRQRRMFVGLSASNAAEIENANQHERIAYIGSGPVFPTTSKADADPVIGIPELTNLVKLSNKPIVAIGGITKANIAELKPTGVSGAAVISMITRSDDVVHTVATMKEVFD